MSEMLESYRANLHAAQRALEIAESVKDEFKRQGLIEWGTSRSGVDCWLVKSKKADVAYSGWARAKAEVEHWGNLVNEELAKHSQRTMVNVEHEAMTPEEVGRRKADINAQFEAKFGAADRRLPPEKDDDDGEVRA